MPRLPSGHFAGAATVDQVRLSQALDAVGDLAPDRVAPMVAFLRQRGGGPPGALGSSGDRLVARGHDSSVISRYSAYSANHVITTTAATSRSS